MNRFILQYIIDCIYLFSGIGLHELASRKGYNQFYRVMWCSLGFYFGPLILPIGLIFLRKK